jgi:hypothetical protein
MGASITSGQDLQGDLLSAERFGAHVLKGQPNMGVAWLVRFHVYPQNRVSVGEDT